MSFVALCEGLIAEARGVAALRHRAAVSWGRRDVNLQSGQLPSFELHLQGVFAEIAAREFFAPIHWSGFVDAPSLDAVADLAGFIDVKGVMRESDRLMVAAPPMPQKQKLVRDWAYVLVRGHRHPIYEIVGWLWGCQIEDYPISDPKGGRPARFVPPRDLYRPEDLRPLIDFRCAA